MLIGYVGAPCSGKTTIATKLFSSLKEAGVKSEIIVEQARQYIANIRYEKGLGPEDEIKLTDEDQIKIYSAQVHLENIMKHSCGLDTIVVSDSSAYNASLYLSNGFLDKPDRPFFTNLNHHYDIVFYCHPIELKVLPDDPNRVHTLQMVKEAQDKSLKLLNIMKRNNVNVKELVGTMTSDQRYLQSSSYVLDLYMNIIQRL